MPKVVKEFSTVMPGVQLRHGKRGDTIRFSAMIRGRRWTKMCDLPIELCLTDKGSATRELKAEYARWIGECDNQTTDTSSRTLRIPTISELIECYEDIAWKRHNDPAYGQPSERYINETLKRFSYCVEASGLRTSRPYTELTDPDMVRAIFKYYNGRRTPDGRIVSGISAWTYVSALQSVTASWAILEYRDRGYTVSQVKLPDFGKVAKARQYTELPLSTINKIWEWYLGIETNAEYDVVFYATCMLELAMRPIDIGKLSAANFPLDESGTRRFAYTPSKTRGTSNRRVDIPIPTALYDKLHALVPDRFRDGLLLLPNWRWTGVKVNNSLRSLCGLSQDDYGKAGYELRKLCIHTILNTPVELGGGIDQAVRLSGDRRETIEKYYCDPYKSHAALPERPLGRFVDRLNRDDN